MKFSEAVKILDYEDYEKSATQEEHLEAMRVFWKTLFNVDIENKDGSYKSILDIFKEASNEINK